MPTPEEVYDALETDVQLGIAELWRKLASGEMTPADWRNEMGDLLALYLSSAWILGEDGEAVIDSEGLQAYIESQFAYLDNFANQLEVAIEEYRKGNFVGVLPAEYYRLTDDGRLIFIGPDGEEIDATPINLFFGYPNLNAGRAAMYGSAIWAAYQQGKGAKWGEMSKYGLHLPAYPADGSAICKTRDRCEWLIEPLNLDEGEYNATWTLGQAEHCPTCLQRAKEWNPLYIWHGWPVYETKSLKERVVEAALKHRQGMHNQKRHGWRFGSLDKARSSMRGQDVGEREAYRKRAGMPVPTKKPKGEEESKAMTGVKEYDTEDVRLSNQSWSAGAKRTPLLGGNREKFIDHGVEYLYGLSNKFDDAGKSWAERFYTTKPTQRQDSDEKITNQETRKAFVAPTNVRSVLKSDIVSRVAKRGADEDDVATNVNIWARTSNDENPTALAVQMAASQQFGVNLSKWQSAKAKEMNESRYPTDHIDTSYIPKDKSYWKAVYKETQSFFQKAGYKPDDEIVLYRGMTGKGQKGKLTGKARYEGNVVESWSFDVAVARSFSDTSMGGIIMSAKIKVKDIVSSCFTGPGCLTEMEVIVLGSRPNQEVYIYDISE